MSDLTSDLQRTLEAEKNALSENLAFLADKTRELTDWRVQVGQHPLAAVGIAASAGLLLAMITDRRPARRRGGHDGMRDSANGNRLADLDRPAPSHPAIDRMVNALVGVALTKAFDFAAEVVPGFTDQFADDEPVPFSLDDAPRPNGMHP